MWIASAAKFAQFIGIVLLLGLPAFWFILWHPSAPTQSPGSRRLLGPALIGAFIILAAMVTDLIRILWPLLPGLSLPDQLGLASSFLRNTEVGRWFAVRPVAIAGYLAVLALSVRVLDKRYERRQDGGEGTSDEDSYSSAEGTSDEGSSSDGTSGEGNSAVGPSANAGLPRLLQVALIAWGLMVVASISLAGHAAVSLGPVLGGLVDGVHLVATTMWAGALWGMATIARGQNEGARQGEGAGTSGVTPQDAIDPSRLLRIVERISWIGLVAVLTLSGTGFALASAHVFSPAVAAGSMYGRSLTIKLIFFVVLLVLAAGNRFRWIPALRKAVSDGRQAEGRGKGDPVRGWRRRFRAEAWVLLAVLGATAILTQVWPPSTPGRLMEAVTWTREVGPWQVDLALTPARNASVDIRVEVTDRATGERMAPDRLSLAMDMETHVMGVLPPRLRQVEPGVYQGSTYFIMPGRWQLDLSLAESGLTETVTVFADTQEVPLTDRAPLQIVLKGGVLGPISFAFGLFVAAAGVWLLAHWVVLLRGGGAWGGVVSGLFFLLGGAFWILHLALNPTAYTSNPVQASESVAEEARPLYEQHCLSCHGETGRGDGPSAAGLTPPPADFAVHVGHHREGEFFWMITHGRRGTAMPAFQTVLTEDERWLLTRYVRELGFAARSRTTVEEKPEERPEASGRMPGD